MIDVSCRRLFLASPGGLEEEREAVANIVDEYNRLDMVRTSAAYVLETWQKVPGGVGRGQALINELVAACDYLVLILWDRWGSPTGLEEYSSGTEEEFRLAESLFADKSSQMSDILILFKGVSAAQLRDPGEQLQKVRDFKLEIESSRKYLFKTFDTISELQGIIRAQLAHWAKGPVSELAPSAAKESEVIASDGLSILETAERFASRGLSTQAEAAYAKAVADDDIDALRSYARFLRRSNRLSASLEIDERIISLLAGETTHRAREATAETLASMGIIERKRDRLEDSRYKLAEAVATLRELPTEHQKSLPYALDNLGTTYRRLTEYEKARDCYEESLRLREERGDLAGLVDANLNIGRLAVQDGELELARSYYQEAQTAATQHGNDSQIARSLAGDAEIDGKEGNFRKALEKLDSARELNESLAQPGAVGLVMSQIARMKLALGDTSVAENAIDRAIREHELVGSVEGLSGARLIKAQILAKAGKHAEALRLAQAVVEEHRRGGDSRFIKRAQDVILEIEELADFLGAQEPS